MQGLDLSRQLAGGPGAWREQAFATATQRRPALYALRTATHKLIADVDSGEMRLYDLLGDPTERSDISQARPQLAAELRQALEARIRESAARARLSEESTAVPDADRQRLRALGYVK
jgi:hypothetical protein